jgi:hypothetical protein
MKLIATALIAAIVSVALLGQAEAAPRKLPAFMPANANLQMTSIRHNSIKVRINIQYRSIGAK